MPVEYKCRACSLLFGLGWFHFHDFTSGYGAAALGVCRTCGTQQQALIGIPEGMVSEWLEYYEVRLCCLPKESVVPVMAELRRECKMAVSECRDAVRKLPPVLKSEAMKEDAEELVARYEELGATAEMELNRREPNPMWALPQKNKLQWQLAGPETDSERHSERRAPSWKDYKVQESARAPAGEIIIEAVPCGHCGATSIVFEDWEPFDCPRCGEGTLEEVGCWVT